MEGSLVNEKEDNIFIDEHKIEGLHLEEEKDGGEDKEKEVRNANEQESLGRAVHGLSWKEEERLLCEDVGEMDGGDGSEARNVQTCVAESEDASDKYNEDEEIPEEIEEIEEEVENGGNGESEVGTEGQESTTGSTQPFHSPCQGVKTPRVEEDVVGPSDDDSTADGAYLCSMQPAQSQEQEQVRITVDDGNTNLYTGIDTATCNAVISINSCIWHI